MSSEPNGVDLVILLLEVGGILALRQSVDAVVEQEDLEVHVAAQCVDQVVAPMDNESPSPVMTHTDRSGRLTERPVAIAGRGHGSNAIMVFR